MVRTSLPESETACLHPESEEAMIKWLTTRSHPAFLLIGPPGVGKTTMITKMANTAMNMGYNVLQVFFEDNPNFLR